MRAARWGFEPLHLRLRSMIEGGRRKIANRVSPDSGMVTLTEIDDQTVVVERGGRKTT